MNDCCAAKSNDLDRLADKQARVLWFVLAINAGMFAVELVAGLASSSVALISDSLDMFGDALAYGSSLFVLRGSLVAKAQASRFKGWLMALVGVAVFGRVVWQFITEAQPEAYLMGYVAVGALVANGICLLLLTRHRQDDINMRSIWVCSRNDIIANVGVIGAAVLVGFTGSRWPDLVVGLVIMVLFLRSALAVLGEARAVLFSTVREAT